MLYILCFIFYVIYFSITCAFLANLNRETVCAMRSTQRWCNT